MKKIVIIEDERMMHFIYKQLIGMQSDLKQIEVLSAYDYAEGIALLKSLTELKNPDICVLLDLDLGDGHTGWEILESEYIGRSASCMVYICSSSSSILDQTKALEFPVVKGYFQKPITPDAIRTIADRFLS